MGEHATFAHRVGQCEGLAESDAQKGLGSLTRDERASVKVSNNRALDGSVDIDTCLKSRFPRANRWDYAIGYDGAVYFVEFHHSSEAREVGQKADWLRGWLGRGGRALAQHGSTPLYWVESGSITSGRLRQKDKKRMAQKGVVMAGRTLSLPPPR